MKLINKAFKEKKEGAKKHPLSLYGLSAAISYVLFAAFVSAATAAAKNENQPDKVAGIVSAFVVKAATTASVASSAAAAKQ